MYLYNFDHIKGTPKYLNLEVADYLGALFDNKIPRVKYNQIGTDRREGTAVTRSVTKKSLNPIYLKANVLDDLITVKPLQNPDGSYV